jgi:tRNA threonylcarbamoyladenosine biosynthesis protein TsaB
VALILNIDTSLEAASITLADHGNVLAEESNENQKDHAAWVQPAIETLIKNAHSDLRNVKAIGISNGPGSYTGLRIGLATAKGLCYALGIPLITINTLAVLAFDAITKIERGNLQIFDNDSNAERSDFTVAGVNIEKMLFCPMIDARRMEVFTAVYNSRLTEIIQPQACILIPTLFEELLERQKILFLGNGNKKFQPMCQNAGNAMFRNLPLNSSALAALTYRNFVGSNFAGLAYTEPLYLKEFFTQ